MVCVYVLTCCFFFISGAQFGTVISMPLSGVLSEYGFAGGWPSIFYVFGAIGTLWSVAFLLLVHEDPESHPTIPHDERKYIISSVWGAAGVSVSVEIVVTIGGRVLVGGPVCKNHRMTILNKSVRSMSHNIVL